MSFLYKQYYTCFCYYCCLLSISPQFATPIDWKLLCELQWFRVEHHKLRNKISQSFLFQIHLISWHRSQLVYFVIQTYSVFVEIENLKILKSGYSCTLSVFYIGLHLTLIRKMYESRVCSIESFDNERFFSWGLSQQILFFCMQFETENLYSPCFVSQTWQVTRKWELKQNGGNKFWLYLLSNW